MMTPHQYNRVIHLLGHGHDYQSIADSIGSTRNAVEWVAIQEDLRRHSIPNLYGLRDVAALFLVDKWTVDRWCDVGWLKVVYGSRPKRVRRMTHDDVLAFIEHQTGWLAWNPVQVQDKHLQAWAKEVRAVEWEWLNAKEAAKVVGITRQHIAKRCREGRYASATWYNHAWYVRSDEV